MNRLIDREIEQLFTRSMVGTFANTAQSATENQTLTLEKLRKIAAEVMPLIPDPFDTYIHRYGHGDSFPGGKLWPI
jgi:hypothetical protein